MDIPVNESLELSRRSDYVQTVAEVNDMREHVAWPEGTQVWIEFSSGERWDAEVNPIMATASFVIDKVETDKIEQNTKYWVYIMKPDGGKNVDMLLKYGAVVRRG